MCMIIDRHVIRDNGARGLVDCLRSALQAEEACGQTAYSEAVQEDRRLCTGSEANGVTHKWKNPTERAKERSDDTLEFYQSHTVDTSANTSASRPTNTAQPNSTPGARIDIRGSHGAPAAPDCVSVGQRDGAIRPPPRASD
ncbi:hypothetical protein AAFF_G00105050 [Aldrovandia affinis]|uniref:Uncharacterized protein n=1 Tax=Aldrovandia affinis TaxID=143900 RepID=A0AAD7T2Q5_9TELE|nr:hypothetical protein AAFF_G00105050 [Aldrovandia affinis]